MMQEPFIVAIGSILNHELQYYDKLFFIFAFNP